MPKKPTNAYTLRPPTRREINLDKKLSLSVGKRKSSNRGKNLANNFYSLEIYIYISREKSSRSAREDGGNKRGKRVGNDARFSQLGGGFDRALLTQIRESQMGIVPFLPERHVVVGGARAEQRVVAVVVERVQYGCRVVVVQRGGRVAAVVLSSKCGSPQRVDVRIRVGPRYARGARRSRRLRAYRALLTCERTQVDSDE